MDKPAQITVDYGGKSYLIECCLNGVHVPPDDALKYFASGLIKPLKEVTTYRPASPAPKANIKRS